MAEPFQVYQKAPGAVFFVRFSIRGQGQIRKSCGTKDEAEARKAAVKIYYEANYRAEQGLKAAQHTFTAVADEFIKHMHNLSASGKKYPDRGVRTESILRRYFIPYFGDRGIDAITDTDIYRYLEWRKAYWITGPGSTVTHIEYRRNGKLLRRPCTDLKRGSSLGTQRAEAVVLRQLFAQAAKWGYLNKGKLPEVKLTKAPPAPRPSFSFEEMHKLLKIADERCYDKSVNDEVRRDRRWLRNYVNIAAMTGMRPAEMKNLKWTDVLGYQEGFGKKLKDRDIRIRCLGKNKHRTFVPLAEAIAAFDDLWLMQDPRPRPSDPVFGRRKLNKSLNALLEAGGLAVDYRGKKRDSYSFRHFYISQQIRSGVDVFLLARNCGTSPDMIDKH